MPALLKKILITGPLALAMMAGAFGFLFWKGIHGRAEAEEAAKTAPTAPPSASSAQPVPGGTSGSGIATGEQYVAAVTPMVDDVPWSAPGFVGREFRSDPHVYCMSSENNCRCVTEQNTRIQTIRDDVCRDIARYGEP